MWEFSDNPNTAVFTSWSILRGEFWIGYVSHDLDDGCWQFHAFGGIDGSAPAVVGLEEIVAIDPSIASLADLPLGWNATRNGPDVPWTRKLTEPI